MCTFCEVHLETFDDLHPRLVWVHEQRIVPLSEVLCLIVDKQLDVKACKFFVQLTDIISFILVVVLMSVSPIADLVDKVFDFFKSLQLSGVECIVVE